MADLPKSSPSDINLWLQEPALWLLKKMLGVRASVGPNTLRGRAVEHGINTRLLHGGTLADAIGIAQANYRELTLGVLDDETEAEFAAIAPMVENAYPLVYIQSEKPILQRHVELELDGLLVSGYVDYDYSDHTKDLKTTRALPREPRERDIRQQAFYAVTTGKPAELVYVTTKKHACFRLTHEQVLDGMAHLRMGARAIARLWAGRDCWEEWLGLFPPRDLSSFYWDDETRELARRLWA